VIGGPYAAPALVTQETHPLLPHAGDPLVDSKYFRLAREDLVEQHAVDLLVGIGTAVAQHDEPIVQVGGLAQCRENDATRRDPGQDKGLHALSPQNHVEIAPGEGTDAPLVDHDVPGLGFDRRVDLRGGPFATKVEESARAAKMRLFRLTSGAPTRNATRTYTTGIRLVRAPAAA
jgi:hypothetical protein